VVSRRRLGALIAGACEQRAEVTADPSACPSRHIECGGQDSQIASRTAVRPRPHAVQHIWTAEFRAHDGRGLEQEEGTLSEREIRYCRPPAPADEPPCERDALLSAFAFPLYGAGVLLSRELWR